MDILVYGAGPLGSILAARLQQGGHQVSLLAKGHRLQDLRKHGIVLHDALGRTASSGPDRRWPSPRDCARKETPKTEET